MIRSQKPEETVSPPPEDKPFYSYMNFMKNKKFTNGPDETINMILNTIGCSSPKFQVARR